MNILNLESLRSNKILCAEDVGELFISKDRKYISYAGREHITIYDIKAGTCKIIKPKATGYHGMDLIFIKKTTIFQIVVFNY